MEPQWNPMAETQAIDRVHRIGQHRDVAIHRYVVRNSIESVRCVAVVAVWFQADTHYSTCGLFKRKS